MFTELGDDNDLLGYSIPPPSPPSLNPGLSMSVPVDDELQSMVSESEKSEEWTMYEIEEQVEERSAASEASQSVKNFLQSRERSSGSTKSVLDIGHDMEVPPSIQFLQSSYENWKKEKKTAVQLSHLSKSKQAKVTMQFSFKAAKAWSINFPWMQFITVDGVNVGALCKVCRDIDPEEFEQYKASSLNKSGGKWVTVPFVYWGDVTEAAKKHELGNQYEKTSLAEIKQLRKKILDGTAHIPNTFHMQIHMKRVTKQKAIETNNTVVDSIKKSEKHSVSRQEENEMAYEKTISILHRTIKRRDSPFSSLKDAIKFQRDVMGNNFFNVVLRHIDENKDEGVSHRLIGEMVDCIFDAVNLSIYAEMCEGLVSGEAIVFGSSIDTGTKIKKTKNYAGVGVKYFAHDQKSAISRGIGFLKTPRKDGIHLLLALKTTFERFNSQILRLLDELGDDLFPVDIRPLPTLQLENMDSMSVDGALISKDKMINKRVLACNPRTIVTWCADHRVNLTIGDGLANKRVQEFHDVCVKLYDLVNASSRTEDLFLRCQESTGESQQFKANKPVCLGDRPMHRWESSLKFNTKLMKLLLTVEAYLAEIKVRNIANNAKLTKIYTAHYIAKKFMKPYFLITLAMETDLLDILVSFIKNTEFTDNDLVHFLDESENVTLDLMELKFEKGYTNSMINRITNGDLRHIEGGGDALDIKYWKSIFAATITTNVANWKERFADKTLSMYLIFSMSKFRKLVGTNLERWELFAAEPTDKLVNYFCKEVTFTATYPEDKGKVFVAAPLGEEEELRKQVKLYCREVSRHYMGVNPDTHEVWTTKEMLVNMLCVETPVWLPRKSILHRIMRSYMSLMFESADNERIMSSHTLLDSNLNQASMPKRVEQMVVIHKESSSWMSFDSKAVLLLWRKAKARQLHMPPMRKEDLFQKDKCLLKKISVIKEAHNARLRAWRKKFSGMGNDTDGDVAIQSDSDNECDEKEQCHADHDKDERSMEEHGLLEADLDEDKLSSLEHKEELAETDIDEDELSLTLDHKEQLETDGLDEEEPLAIDSEEEKLAAEEQDLSIPQQKVIVVDDDEKKTLVSQQQKKKESRKRKIEKSSSKAKKMKVKVTSKGKGKKGVGKIFRHRQQVQDREAAEKMARLKDVIQNPNLHLNFSNLKIDELALGMLPTDVPSLPQNAVTLKASPDGNCLFHSVSILLVGNQTLSGVLRQETADKLMQYLEYFSNHPAFVEAMTDMRRSADQLFPNIVSRNSAVFYHDHGNDKLKTVELEAESLEDDGFYGSMLALYALAEVVKRPIFSIYPNVKVYRLRPLFHRLIVPAEVSVNEPIHLLWMRSNSLDGNNQFDNNPNHFVPVVSG